MGMTPGYNHRLRLHNTLPFVLSHSQLQLFVPYLLSAENIFFCTTGGGGLTFLSVCRSENKTKATESPQPPPPPQVFVSALLSSVWANLLFSQRPSEGRVELCLRRLHRDAAADKTKEKMIFVAIRQRKQNLMEMRCCCCWWWWVGAETKHFRKWS